MRHSFWPVIVFAMLGRTGAAQWRHFGEGQPVSSRFSLARDMLVAHNSFRASAGVAPLAWSERLAAHAQDWADQLIAHKRFAHRPNSQYGENLFQITGATSSPAHVVNTWAEESRNYDYKSNGCHGVCGHYTQIVWAETREVGCAVARGDGREIWVCVYDPPGNVVGKQPY